MADEKIVVLMPARFSYRVPPISKSTIIEAGCGHLGLASQATVRFLTEHPDATTICSECVDQAVIHASTVPKMLVPGGRKEIEDDVGVALADQLIARASEHGFWGEKIE